MRRRINGKLLLGGLAIGAIVFLLLAALPGSWEIKLVATALVIIAGATTWYRVRYLREVGRGRARSLPVSCAVSWRERERGVRDDRFPVGGFGGKQGVLRIDEAGLSWGGETVGAEEVEAAIALGPREWSQRASGRTVLRIRTAHRVWDFYLSEPWILERELPFSVERRTVPAQQSPARRVIYGIVLAALFGFVLLAGPLDFWRSKVPQRLGGPRSHERPPISFSYPGSAWRVTESAAEPGIELDLKVESPSGGWVAFQLLVSNDSAEDEVERRVAEAERSGCLRGAWVPVYGQFRGAGQVLTCGVAEERVSRRVFARALDSGGILVVRERRSSAEAVEEAAGFSMIESSLQLVDPAEG